MLTIASNADIKSISTEGLSMEHVSIGKDTAEAAIVRYPDDLDITTYDDGCWHYAASYPDEIGSYREVYLAARDGGGWELRLYDHVGSTEIHGMTTPRWELGFVVDRDRSGEMSYETARGSAEAWLRGGRIFGVA